MNVATYIFQDNHSCSISSSNCMVLFVVHRVRLIGGPDVHAGRVEIYTNSTGGLDDAQWWTICDDYWDIQDARVICHQLGYPDAVVTPLFAHKDQGAGPIWLNNVQCLGNESNIFACEHSKISGQNCEHLQHAFVECSSKSTKHRLL